MKFVLGSMLVMSTTFLSGCTFLFGDSFRDRGLDYQTNEAYPEMKQVEGQDLLIQPAMPIPELSAANQVEVVQVQKNNEDEGTDEFEVPRPFPLVDDGVEDDSVASLSDYQSNELNPRIEKDGAGTQVLRLDGRFIVAWAAVSDALARSQYLLTDLNRSVGTYYLEIPVASDEESSGFWSWLFGPDEPEAQVYLLKMNRSRLGVYLSLQQGIDELANEEITLEVLNSVKTLLESRGR